MDKHDATEVAYKNGYERGYNQGVKDFAERAKTYYNNLSGRPLPDTIEYYLSQIAKDMIKEDQDDE
jgi:hypothetical protein